MVAKVELTCRLEDAESSRPVKADRLCIAGTYLSRPTGEQRRIRLFQYTLPEGGYTYGLQVNGQTQLGPWPLVNKLYRSTIERYISSGYSVEYY